MTIPYSEKINLLSKSMDKVRDESDLDRKTHAAAELLEHAGDLGTHIARFSRIAYCLDILLLFIFFTIFCLAILFIEVLEDIIPPDLYQSVYSILDAEPFLYFLLGLVLLPVVITVILALACRQAEVAAGQANDGETAPPAGGPDDEEELPDRVRDYVQKKLSYIEDTLDNVQNELNPVHRIPLGLGYGLSVLFMVSMTCFTVYAFIEYNKSTLLDLLVAVFSAAFIFVVSWGFIRLLLWLKLSILTLLFSSWKSRRKAGKLRKAFSVERSDYGEKCEAELDRRKAEALEQKRLADLKEGAELYKKAIQGKTVDENLMVLAAEKGDPQASLHVGEQIFMLIDDSGLTAREIAEFREDAKDYFKVAADTGIPDGIFWHAALQLITEAHDESGWMQILRRVRALEKAKLSESCLNVYDTVIEQLVGAVDDAADRAEKRRKRQEAEDAALWEDILRRPCRYTNGTICTLKSTPSFPHICNGDGKGKNFCVNYAK